MLKSNENLALRMKEIPPMYLQQLQRFVDETEGRVSGDDIQRWLEIDGKNQCVLRVPGNLDLSKCLKLTTLPENLKVQGSLWLGGCDAQFDS